MESNVTSENEAVKLRSKSQMIEFLTLLESRNMSVLSVFYLFSTLKEYHTELKIFEQMADDELIGDKLKSTIALYSREDIYNMVVPRRYPDTPLKEQRERSELLRFILLKNVFAYVGISKINNIHISDASDHIKNIEIFDDLPRIKLRKLKKSQFIPFICLPAAVYESMNVLECIMPYVQVKKEIEDSYRGVKKAYTTYMQTNNQKKNEIVL